MGSLCVSLSKTSGSNSGAGGALDSGVADVVWRALCRVERVVGSSSRVGLLVELGGGGPGGGGGTSGGLFAAGAGVSVSTNAGLTRAKATSSIPRPGRCTFTPVSVRESIRYGPSNG